MKGFVNVMRSRFSSHVIRLPHQNVSVGWIGAHCAPLPNALGLHQKDNEAKYFVGLSFPLAGAIAILAATSGNTLANCAGDGDATIARGTNAPTNICVAAQKVLRLSKGRVRVPLEDLGPSTWNRFSEQSLSGKHMMQLGERIFDTEGFATYRYVAGWCHEPNPEDSQEVWKYASANARLDPLLPDYAKKELKGVFAKNHLVALLQCVKAGNRRLPNAKQMMGVPEGPDWDELRDVMKHGIWMEVFDYNDVRDNFKSFEWLMASDNFDSAFALAEDELSVIDRISHSLKHTFPKPGVRLWDAVMTEIKPLNGNRWSEQDLVRFGNFVKSTNCEKSLPFLKVFNKFMVDLGNFHVHSKFYDAVSSINPKHQMIRLALCCWQISSDPDTECEEAAGHVVAAAVEKRHFDVIRGCSDNVLLQFEDCCKHVFQKYWVDLLGRGSWPDNELLAAVGGFLVRLAKCVTRAKLVIDSEDGKSERTDALIAIEKKLRVAMSAGDRQRMLPSPVLHVVDDSSESVAGGTKRKATLDTAPVILFDEDGGLVRDVGLRARELGMAAGATVQLCKKSKGIEAGTTCVVEEIRNDCVVVKVDGSGLLHTFALGVLKTVAAPQGPIEEDKRAAKAQVAERKQARLAAVPQGFAWSPVEASMSQCILGRMIQGWLYHLHCKCSPAHDLLRFALPSEGGSNRQQIYALQDISAKSLFMVPFTDVVIAGDSYAQPGEKTINGFAIHAEFENDQRTYTFYLQPPSWSSLVPGYKDAVDDKPAVVVAFWWAQSLPLPEGELAKDSKIAYCIEPAVAIGPLTCQCPNGRGASNHDALKKANKTTKIKLTFPYLTNSAKLAAGDELVGM